MRVKPAHHLGLCPQQQHHAQHYQQSLQLLHLCQKDLQEEDTIFTDVEIISEFNGEAICLFHFGR